MRHGQAGYSLLEMAVVIFLGMIMARLAMVQMSKAVAALDADVAANYVVSQVAYARQLAVDERRNVVLGFKGTNEIVVTRQNLDGTTTVMSDGTLPSGYTFAFPSGVTDTPDGYLAGSTAYTGSGTGGLAVFVGAGTTGTFQGDGSFADNLNVLLNGSIFTMGSGSGSARAMTLTGSTGTVKEYWVHGTTWVVR
jgi:type II secretory pathway pseudopilin PulG